MAGIATPSFESSTLSAEGRIVVPASFRKQLGLQAGDSLSFRLEGNRLVMTSKAVALAELRGLLPPLPDGRLASEELIAERRQEALREEVER